MVTAVSSVPVKELLIICFYFTVKEPGHVSIISSRMQKCELKAEWIKSPATLKWLALGIRGRLPRRSADFNLFTFQILYTNWKRASNHSNKYTTTAAISSFVSVLESSVLHPHKSLVLQLELDPPGQRWMVSPPPTSLTLSCWPSFLRPIY